VNLYSFFPKGAHLNVFEGAKADNVLTLSGVNNATAKAYVLADYLENHKVNNVFWLFPADQDIHEVQNCLPFWTKYTSMGLDHFMDTEVDDYRMTEALYTIHNGKHKIYLMGFKDSLRLAPTYEELMEAGILIHQNQDLHVVDFFNQLIQMGYQPCSDVILRKGEYRRSGGVVNVFPPNFDQPIKIEVDYDKVSGLWHFNQEDKQITEELERVDILPVNLNKGSTKLIDYLGPNDLLVVDDIDDITPEFDEALTSAKAKRLIFTSFPKSDEKYFHLRYLSVLKYYNLFDLLNDLRDKLQRGWKVNILTKRTHEIQNIFKEENIQYSTKNDPDAKVVLLDATALDHVPASFQNPELKTQLLTDKEIFSLSRTSKSKSGQKINLDFLTGLRMGDLVVHLDHGIGRFLGIVPRTIDEIQREYLEIGYAENDRLFVPIDQADKISKYVGGEENEPNLSRLGSVEWKNVSQKVKKEAQKIAKELLELYAKRARQKRPAYGPDTEEMQAFEKAFPYEETPGQIKAIMDVKKDMEADIPMDRLVCGDVGFGKTEVAMRAAFKAVTSGKQVAFISPITILTDQHYKSFVKRAQGFGCRIEMLSRFRSPKEQKKVLEDLRKGNLDVVVGTHRLLQPDVQFLNLGLVIIDEEQRFGVKQKEKFKEIRNQVDILTMTATPIPRTLNLAMNKLRDISTITTPPPGRLPIITEVRRYSDQLVMESIEKEVARGGQVYFLHNRVQTIDSIAEKLRALLPNVKFIVAHGQLDPDQLEERILKFKQGEVDVLVSSTIIENGIDLPNANTLIVDDAENFGLSQLYQLRGRIGRGKVQAFAYFLYQSRQPRLDAKKRLKAIVDASELGSGFQLSMRDLEIRGAGDILGITQHGSIHVVGVNHFMRMLNRAIEELQEGRDASSIGEEKQDVMIELPLAAFIPNTYIPDAKDKINAYQKLSSVTNLELLEEFRDDLIAEYGHMPKEVSNLFDVLQLKMFAKSAGLTQVRAMNVAGAGKQMVLTMGPSVTPEPIMNLLKFNPKWLISGDKLKIDMKALGFNWMESLKENVKKLQLTTKPVPAKAPAKNE
jgi:transcription-repair coupling factor (superfamily II helicase)